MKNPAHKRTNIRSGKADAHGFAFVEVVVSIGIAAVLLMTFTALVFQGLRVGQLNLSSLKARLYAEEALEAARDLEKSNWALLATCGAACTFTLSGGAWGVVPGSESLDGGAYERAVSVGDVCRDAVGFPNTIVNCPGAFTDPDTKRVTATVSWTHGGAAQQQVIEMFVYNI